MNEHARRRELWRRAADVFERAADLEPEPRARYLEQVFAREPELRSGVEGLLAADVRSEGPLDQPIEHYAAMLDSADLERETKVAHLPQRIGPYRLIRQLGAGGMGVVYEAEDGRLGRRIALKLLADDHEQSDPGFERFARETRTLARLNHPHIVTIHSVEESEGRPFFTMELVEGASLDRLIPADGLSLDRLLRWAAELAGALAAAHERGIVHRDLKPGNVMIDGDGRLKVLDFGLATRSPSLSADEATLSEKVVTAEGMILGTVPYMSPEQAEGLQVDERSDLFSFGSLLYEMASGQRPFTGETRARILSSILRDQPTPLSKRRRGLPQALTALVETCLQKDPEHRSLDADALHQELLRLQLEHESGSLTASRPPMSRNLRLLGVSTLAFVLVVLAVVYSPLISSLTSGRPSARDTAPPSSSPGSAELQQPPGSAFAARIAVLPFESLGEAADDFLAAGIADEISSRLSSVDRLGVISRRSTTRWAENGEDADAGTIGRALGADYLLEGTVRWSSDVDGAVRVRVTPRLIRVADDQQLWSRPYNRLLEDVLGIESSIASQAVTALRVALPGLRERASGSSGLDPLLGDRPTDNLDAYFAYLRGTEAMTRGSVGPEDRLEAVAHLEESVRLDPAFTWAWARLAIARAGAVYTGAYRRGQRGAMGERAREEAEKATELAPSDSLVKLANGFIRYHVDRDYEAAADLLDEAALERPGDVEAMMALGAVQRRLGDYAVATDAFDRAVALEPNDPRPMFEAAWTHFGARHFVRAARLTDAALAIAPDSNELARLRADIGRKTGDLVLARRYAEQAGDDPPFLEITRYERDFDRYLEELDAIEPPASPPAPSRGVWLAYKAWTLRTIGRPLDAEPLLDEAMELVDRLGDLSRGGQGAVLPIPILAMLGRHDEAIAIAEQRPERLGDGSTGDHWWGAQMGDFVAWGLALAGAQDLAIDVLERQLAAQHMDPLTAWDLELDPHWDSLRDNSRFQQLVSGLR